MRNPLHLLAAVVDAIRARQGRPIPPAPTSWNPDAAGPPPFRPGAFPPGTPEVLLPSRTGEPGSCPLSLAPCRDVAWCEAMKTCQRRYDAPSDAPHAPTEGL